MSRTRHNPHGRKGLKRQETVRRNSQILRDRRIKNIAAGFILEHSYPNMCGILTGIN